MKKALVFGGGGAKGAYELGVWKAIKELGIEIDIVTGTSVGALNGAIFAEGDYDLAEKLWMNLTPNQIIKTKETDPRKVYAQFIKEGSNGGADTGPLEELLKMAIDEKKVRKSKIEYGLITCEFPSLKPSFVTLNDIPEGKLIDYLMASATAYPAFRPKLINGSKYVDGGYYDNLPLNLAVNMGADEIIAVNLKAIGRYRKMKNRTVSADIIIPSRDLGSFLMFDKDLVKINAEIGYQDTMKFFGALDGEYFSFKKDELNANGHGLALIYSKLITKIFDAEESRLGDFATIATAKRVLKEFKSSHNRQYAPSIAKLIQGIDCIGSVFKFDDLHIYTFEEFNNLIKSKVQAALLLHPDYLDPKFNLAQIGASKLAQDDPFYFTLFILSRLKLVEDNQLRASDLYPLFLIYPTYALSALYVLALEKYDKRHGKGY